MARHNVGDRVYAIAGSHGNDAVRVFGLGTYQGYQPVPTGRGFMGVEGMDNHCIELDSGEFVFGHECWWGSENAMQPYLTGREVIPITIAEYYQSAVKEES